MMRIAYHSAGATLTKAQLDAWLAATLALDDAGFAALAAPGVLVALTLPDYPIRFEPDTLADDRVSLGGKHYSRIFYTARIGEWAFSRVPTGEVAAWRLWYAATLGFRLPFVAEMPDGARHGVIAPGAFPLTLTSQERWDGNISARGYVA